MQALMEKASETPYSPINMVTVVKSYNIKENQYYRDLLDSIDADDDYRKQKSTNNHPTTKE